MKHLNITFKPDGKKISIHQGATLLEAAGQAGIILNTICGGKGICEKCVVNIEPDGQQVPACQHQIQSDLTVTIPVSSRFFEQKILAEGIAAEARVRPDVWEKYKKPDSANEIYGLVVDIGTTTIVAKLVALTTGQCLATQADLNPQCQYGDDVISRIAYAQTDAKLAELNTLLIECINKMTNQLCNEVSIDAKRIYEICAVGNTTMNHIFQKFPITSLGQAPYKPFSVDANDLSPEEAGLQINPAGNIHTTSNIAGFVGSDTTAVALAVDIDSADDATLAVDIGTNGELVLAASGKLYAASCAAGPAFEGARISCGSRAVESAIEAVIVNDNDIDLDVIGGGVPRSICGSGLIDAMAVLLELGIVDPTGCFVEPEKLPADLPPAIRSRVVKHNDQPAFVLAGQLLLTQEDVRQVQLAKAAIRTGIKLLQKKTGIGDNDIQQVFLAGAFGNYIRRESALRIRLLPAIAPERIRFVGNAASSGALIILLSSEARTKAGELARKIEYVELANEKEFAAVFADSMKF